MATVVARLNGYKLPHGILNMKPFGHLFIEYCLHDSDEEARIFRAGPKGFYLFAMDTTERKSLDSSVQTEDKAPICITQKHINLYVGSSSDEEKLTVWDRFVGLFEQLVDSINNTKTVYGIIINNSNSVASVGWRCMFGDDISSHCDSSIYNFIGHNMMTIDSKIGTKIGSPRSQLQDSQSV